jgi:hypothetical protein
MNPFHSKEDYEASQVKRKKALALRELWNESERILNILRTQGAIMLGPANDEDIEKWSKTTSQHLNRG